MKKILICLMIILVMFSVLLVEPSEAVLGFSYSDISGKTFEVTDSSYPTCAVNVKFEVDGQVLIGDGDVDTYTIQNGVIIVADNISDFITTIELQSVSNATYIGRFSGSGGDFVPDNSFGVDFSSLNNNAENLKDWFIGNGFWPGTAVTADGRITSDSASIDGAWRVEDNIFFFDLPEPGGCVDHKAYKLVNDELLLATDADYTDIRTLTQAQEWQIVNPFPTTGHLGAVTWGGGQFIAVGGSGKIVTSPDGISWTEQISGTIFELVDIVWSGAQFVAVGEGGTVLTSPEGVTWTTQISGTSDGLVGITWSGSQFVAVGEGGTILTSPEGVNWTTQTSGTTNLLTRLTWNGSQYVVLGDLGTILTSPDGINWTSQISGTTNILYRVVWNNFQFVAVGFAGTILTSPDGINWETQVSGTSNNLEGLVWNGSFFVATGFLGTILTSPNGVIWTPQTSGVAVSLFAVTWNGSRFVAVGHLTILFSLQISANDVVVNLPSRVSLNLNNNTSSAALHGDTAEAIAVADVDSNGEDDVIASFLAGNGPGGTGGTYISRNQGALVLLDGKIAEQIAVGNFDGSNGADLFLDFGTDGLWFSLNDGAVTQLTAESPVTMAVGDTDNSGQDDVVLSLSSAGTINIRNFSVVDVLDSTPASVLELGDIDGNGEDDIFASFAPGNGPGGTGGLSFSVNQGALTSLTTLESLKMTSGDFDGSGQDDFLLDFGGATGLVLLLNGASANPLGVLPVVAMASGDVDSSGQDDMILSITGVGTIAFKNLTTVEIFDPAVALDLATGNVNGN